LLADCNIVPVMASQAPNDPPVSTREKGDRIVIVFNIANVKHNSVKVEHQGGGAGTSELVTVKFSAVSPNRSYEKTLVLPHAIEPGKTVNDVQNKCLAVQLVKADSRQTWGTAWTKVKSARAKAKQHVVADAGGASPRKVSDAPSADDLGEADDAVQGEIGTPNDKGCRDEVVVAVVAKAAAEEAREEEESASPAQSHTLSATKVDAPEPPPEVLELVLESAPQDESLLVVDERPEPVVKASSGKSRRARSKKAEMRASEVATMPAGAVDETSKAPDGEGKVATQNWKAAAKAKAPVAKAPTLGKDATAKPTREGLPVMPPSDPKVKELLDQAQRRFATDPHQAANLLRLAARKGYIPAYMLLGQMAAVANDEDLVIDALCSLLSEEAAETQLLPDLLKQCAMQLVATLQDPKHAPAMKRHAQQLEKIKKLWPIANVLKIPGSHGNGVDHTGSTSSPSTPAKQPIPGLAAAYSGRWHEVGDNWKFEVDVPSLSSLSDSRLEMSDKRIQLFGRAGSPLVCTEVPVGADGNRARAKWSQKTRHLLVTLPRLEGSPLRPGASAASAPSQPLSARELGLDLDGVWKAEDGSVIGTISGSHLTWAEGSGATVRRLPLGEIVVGGGAEEVTARLDARGRLCWSDGDVWVREGSRPASIAAPVAAKAVPPALAVAGAKKGPRPAPKEVSSVPAPAEEAAAAMDEMD